MKAKIIIFLAIQVIANLFMISTSYAWTGDPWGEMSRETILRMADEMIDFSWSPLKTIRNWNYGNVWETFSSDQIYKGIAYCQNNPQENWAQFYNVVNNTPGGDIYYGNDCSGFVSISWKLPKRYTTSDFICDALNQPSPCGNYYNSSTDDFVYSLGDIGATEGLLLGDGLVTNGHIILFHSYSEDASGIEVMEQTPYKARYWKWPWRDLISYRPIRRNKINDYKYVLTAKWGSPGQGIGRFDYASHLAVDPWGYVYVVDNGNGRIQKFYGDGIYVGEWGLFYYPDGIAIDSYGNVYVSDIIPGCPISRFDSIGNLIDKWDAELVAYCYPEGLAIDSWRYLYIADKSHYVDVFYYTGQYLGSWGGEGTGDGKFRWPVDIAVGPDDSIYVVDSGNRRIQKLDYQGNFITKWGSYGSGDGQFMNPEHIAVDSKGFVYVTEWWYPYNARVQKFDSNGNFVTKWGSYGTGDGQFRWPTGIAVDWTGNVFVSDGMDERIQRFTPIPLFPSGPTNLTASAESSGAIYLSWEDRSSNETGFLVKRKVGVRGTYSQIAKLDQNVTNFYDVNAIPGSIYFYVVSAYNNEGESSYSNEAYSYTVKLRLLSPNGGEVIPAG